MHVFFPQRRETRNVTPSEASDLNMIIFQVFLFTLNDNMHVHCSRLPSVTLSRHAATRLRSPLYPSATWFKPGRERGCRFSCTFPVQASREGADRGGKVTGPIGSFAFALAAATEFALLSLDIHSTHLFDTIDGTVQRLTFAATNLQNREVLARGVSNVFPLFGLAVLTLSTVFSTDKSSSFRTRVIISWVSLASALATVDALKDSFARLRPAGTLLQSYAFPSGHTCGANLLMGLFLFLLLDPLWDSTRSTSGSGDSDSAQGVEQMGAPFEFDKRLIIWILATCITAAGRIEANRHWLSDTMGGASLSLIFVSASVMLCHYLEGRDDNDVLE